MEAVNDPRAVRTMDVCEKNETNAMKFNETTLRILVRGDYGKCFDFYTEKLGLVPVWGDRNGPYTSFAVAEGQPPCFAILPGPQ